MSTIAQKVERDMEENYADSDVPEGWALTHLGDLVSPSKEKVEPARMPDAPYLSLEHVEANTTRIIGHGLGRDVKSTKSVFRAGDVLYGKLRPYLNKVCVPDFDGICSTDFLVFKHNLWIENRLLLWFLSRPEVVEVANHHSTGVELPRVKFQALASLLFLLPPISEQKRIVAKLEELLAQVNAAHARLARVSQVLKRFRQAVLTAACSEGEVTPLSEIVQGLKYGTSKKCTYKPTGTPVLRIPNIGDCSVRNNDLKYAKLPLKELAALRLVPGDILMIRSNGSASLVGKTALVSEKEADFAYAGYLIRIRANVNRILPEYLNLALQTHSVREQVEIPIRSTSGVHNINSTEVLRLQINLPDLDVQEVAVRRVEALFKLADSIEESVEKATKRADKLTQAILAKAFRGELVPTEAELARREGREYETASYLLARIKAEREKLPAVMSPSARRTRRKGAEIKP